MKAIVYQRYGSPDVLELKQIEKPVIKADEVLVKIRAASVNWLDWHFLTGTPLMARLMAGFLKPKYLVLGVDFSGCVVETGAAVTQFRPGDAVFGSADSGCFAEYTRVSEARIVIKPPNLTFEQAAVVPAAASTALHALSVRKKILPGENILINGASGGVGSFAVQIARSLGAVVTGVTSTRNLEMISSIGAENVIDYTREDFSRNIGCYDLIFDAVAKRSFMNCRRALKPNGIYITTDYSPALAFQGLWHSAASKQKMLPLTPKPPSKADLVYIGKLLENGNIVPVIDRCYKLNEVPYALRYFAKGHARGKVVITV